MGDVFVMAHRAHIHKIFVENTLEPHHIHSLFYLVFVCRDDGVAVAVTMETERERDAFSKSCELNYLLFLVHFARMYWICFSIENMLFLRR